MDYIYDIEPLEGICRILESYVLNLDSKWIEIKRFAICVRDEIRRMLYKIRILK